MITNAEKLRCGGCGNHEIELYINEEKELFAECTRCKSVTTLTVSPKIELGWGEGADGILCVF